MTPKHQPTLLDVTSTLLDVILTNNPDRYQSDVLVNDLSDHCFTACVHNGCSVKLPVLICHRRLLKMFNEQAFLHDLASVNRYRISLIPSVEEAWTFFKIFLVVLFLNNTTENIRKEASSTEGIKLILYHFTVF